MVLEVNYETFFCKLCRYGKGILVETSALEALSRGFFLKEVRVFAEASSGAYMGILGYEDEDA